jgi:hypothetical protein
MFACFVGSSKTEDKAQLSTSKQDKPVAASSWIFEEEGGKDKHSGYHHGFMLQALQEPWSQLPASTRHAEPDWCGTYATYDRTCCSSPKRTYNHGSPDMGHDLHVDGGELVKVSWQSGFSCYRAEAVQAFIGQEHSEFPLSNDCTGIRGGVGAGCNSNRMSCTYWAARYHNMLIICWEH